MAVWVAVLELVCCGVSFYHKSLLQDCDFPSPQFGMGISNWLWVQAGFAALNLLFAPYLQMQVWRRLNEEARERDDPSMPVSDRTKEARTENGTVAASKQDVLEAFKTVFMYDIGVCLYVFAIIASFVCSNYGAQQISQDLETCNFAAGGFPRYSAWIGLFFPVFVGLYMGAWGCSMVWMGPGDALVLRRGLEAAAGVAAAAGRPVPGMGAYHPPREAAARTDRHGVHGGAGARVGGLVGAAAAGRAGNAGPHGPGGFFNACSGCLGGKGAYADVGANAKHQLTVGPDVRTAGGRQDVELQQQQYQSKPSCAKSFTKLVASIGLDMLGNATYLFPAVGEYGDAVFAPASAVMLKMMYNANGVAAIGFVEEILPFTDIVPTATIAWCLQHLAPNNALTRAVGINNTWEMTSKPQR